MTVPAKMVCIGIDAAEKDLILQWAEAGWLPTMRSLLDRGTWGFTVAPAGLYVGAIWPSFWTGVSPARHGRYSPVQLHTGTYEAYQFRPFHLKAEPFWNALSRNGRRVAIIDVPKTSPSEQLNGIQVVDWATHDPELGFATWPPSLAYEIEGRFGRGRRDASDRCDAVRSGPAQYAQFRDGLVSSVTKKAALTSHLLDRGDWDFVMSVFSESHCVGHQCWHLHDPTHPSHDREVVRLVGDPIKDVYIAIDAAIGQLLQQVGSETTVLILASHGMGPAYDATFLLDKILRRLEKAEEANSTATVRRGARVLGWAWGQAPLRVRKLLKPVKNRVREKLAGALLGMRKSFQVLNSNAYGGIRVNVADREPRGRVRRGPEYDAYCEGLIRDLLALVNVDTGRPVVRNVIRTVDLYEGPCIDDLPDLLVEWSREGPISTVDSPKTGMVQGSYQGYGTGDHRPDGLFIALGPSIGRRHFKDSVSIMDFAPTITSRLGVSLPDVDGKPVAALTDNPGAGSKGQDPARQPLLLRDVRSTVT